MTWVDNFKRYDPGKEGYGNKKQWKHAFNKRMTSDEAKLILQEEDPYFILGINQFSSQQEIKSAYRKLALKWHPDKNLNNIELATKMMQKINAAYTILIN